jgi:hypothetical protein
MKKEEGKMTLLDKRGGPSCDGRGALALLFLLLAILVLVLAQGCTTATLGNQRVDLPGGLGIDIETLAEASEAARPGSGAIVRQAAAGVARLTGKAPVEVWATVDTQTTVVDAAGKACVLPLTVTTTRTQQTVRQIGAGDAVPVAPAATPVVEGK